MPLKRSGQLFSTLMFFWLSGGAALADEPLPLPEDKTVCSPSGIYCAEVRVGSGPLKNDPRTTVLKSGKALWSMPGWFRDPYLADNGDHLVVGNDGLGLIPMRYNPPITILTFWRRGELVRKVPLSEIVLDASNLGITGSHRLWGRTLGFDEQGRFVVQTVEDRALAFDPKSGLLVDIWPKSLHEN
ncbi:hypothetical protein [Pelagibius marinus]|uniref:hypothetical protein n=1 Tax=Pelagibius marinus TaxID=2762760 RepID=UPI001872F5E4|nr:hypothetical protein [Pelagibius marinus]